MQGTTRSFLEKVKLQRVYHHKPGGTLIATHHLVQCIRRTYIAQIYQKNFVITGIWLSITLTRQDIMYSRPKDIANSVWLWQKPRRAVRRKEWGRMGKRRWCEHQKHMPTRPPGQQVRWVIGLSVYSRGTFVANVSKGIMNLNPLTIEQWLLWHQTVRSRGRSSRARVRQLV